MQRIIAVFIAIGLFFAALFGFSKIENSEPDLPTPEKPVIYLYPIEPTVVEVTMETIGAEFTLTIPAYGDGWRVLAHPDGTLQNLADGKEYPYLFWESVDHGSWPYFNTGFLVARADLEEFLREKLTLLGLLPVEYEEYLEYWLPSLLPNEFTLIHFAGKIYDSTYPLTITPEPDSLLRVHTVFKAATGREGIAPQTLEPFERHGFAVIEWGGTVLK